MCRKTLLFSIGVLFVFLLFLSLCVESVKAENENALITEAQSSINQAFTNVLAAEQSGGDVTDLMLKLNNAGALLAEAENSFRSGAFDGISSKAVSARMIANQVNDDALALRNESSLVFQNVLFLNLMFSIIGSILFSLLVLFAWRFFKRRFINRLLDKQPKVVREAF